MVWVLPYLTPFTVPIIHISLTGSVYSVVAVALERFMTVCFPFTQCSMCHGLGYIIPIILFSVSYNFVKFFEIETAVLEHEEWGVDENGTNISTIIFYPINNATSLRADPDYQKYVVFVLNFVMMGEKTISRAIIFFSFSLFRSSASDSVVSPQLHDLQINLQSYCYPQQHIFISQVNKNTLNPQPSN